MSAPFVPVDPLASMTPFQLRRERDKARALLATCTAKGRTHGARSMRQYIRTITAELRERASTAAADRLDLDGESRLNAGIGRALRDATR